MHELNILLKIEFRRAFKNKLFAASIVIGLALAAGTICPDCRITSYRCTWGI